MNKEVIQQELRDLLEVIKDQQEQVLTHSGTIPQIEMDILMSNIRKMYERLTELNKINAVRTPETPFQQPTPERVNPFIPPTGNTDQLLAAITPDKSFVAEMTETKIEELEPIAEAEIAEVIAFADEMPEMEPIPAQVPEPMQPEVLIVAVDTPVIPTQNEVVKEEILPQVALANERTKEFTKPTAKVQGMASLFDDAPTIADKFHATKSLHDKIAAESQDKSIAVKLQKNPVTDLRKSIGINEKFAFINELFDGDLNNYNEAIELLNNSNGHQHAIETLQSNLTEKYSWSGGSEAYLKLKDLIDRRFTS